MKDLFSTTILGIIAVAVVVGAWSLSDEKPTFVPKTTASLAPVDLASLRGKLLDSRVLGSGENARVQYAFIGEPVPEKLDEEEVEWMRTESSWTINRTSQKDFDAGKYGLETRIFPQKTFVKRPDGWHTIEHGEAPIDEFDQAMGEGGWFASLFNTAYADTLNIYGAVGDGWSQAGSIISVTWASAHAATDGAFTFYTDVYLYAFSSVLSGKFGYATIDRAFVPFDTSNLSTQATISAATLNLYVTSTYDSDNDGNDYVTVVQTSQTSHTSLANADFDQCGAVTSPTEGVDAGQRKDITSVSSNAYLSFTLNSTGRGWIKRAGQASNCSSTTGITCFGIRDGHDANNDPVADDTSTGVVFSSSEATGISQDPYLAVTYTVPQAVLSGGIWLSAGGGKLQVVGGKVQIN